jgi:uncharacterized membrane protein
VDWERFMGARLLAWLGGLALFLGVAYFVKYSFDHDLIPPGVRVFLGLLTGLGLIGGGLALRPRAYTVTAHTLCGTGVVILYAALYAGHTLYQLPWLPQGVAFLAMSLVTAGAFYLAVRFPAQVVAALGILGGFLTPLLVASGSDRPVALFSYLAFLNVGLLAVALRQRWHLLPLLGALGTVLLQAGWLMPRFSEDRLGLALVIFAGFNALFAGALFFRRAQDDPPHLLPAASALQAGATLLLAAWLLHDQQLGHRPGMVFALVLIADLALLTIAWQRPSLALGHLIGGSFALGLVYSWQERFLPTEPLGWALGLAFGFGVLHALFPVVLHRYRPHPLLAGTAPFLPALGILTPFLLLAHVVLRIQLADPTPVFAVALALLILLFVFASLLRSPGLPLAGLAALTLLLGAWILDELPLASHPLRTVGWAAVFLTAFTLYPFLARPRPADPLEPDDRLERLPWAAAALAGLPLYFLVHPLVRDTWPNDVMGLVPVAFAVAPALAVVFTLKHVPPTHPHRVARLAWLAGAVLFFLTAALPVQFDRQWLTLAFALEGAALLALFHRLPHPGLRWTGTALLTLTFLRLVFPPGFFPAVYRGDLPFWNHWLYAYGLSILATFIGARLTPAPARLRTLPIAPYLVSLGVILLFVLVNLQIADFFTSPGDRVIMEFSGNFARDMSYTIAWALFALALVGSGIARRLPAARWCGLGLLGIAVAKLFLHDLARLDQLYRVGALIAVALIAITASVLYQRFIARDTPSPQPHPPA